LYEEIRQQFDIIKYKNHELDKYQQHLEILVEERTKEMLIAQKKAKESDLLKATLLSNIYHEIRTPLNAIIGFTQLLGIEEKIKNTDYLKIIDKNADDLLGLVDNIIELSKLQSDNGVIEINKIRISEMMQNLLNETSIVKEAHRKNKIEVVPDFNELMPSDYIYTNMAILEKILKQLIDNALKYTQEGFIRIGCKISEKKAIFHVTDTGIGIEKDKIPFIFNAFHKIEDHNNLHRGIGIGLAISKQLSEKINGQLLVESEYKKGTKFVLQIPVISI
jgi:signal transduction histidine kinase